VVAVRLADNPSGYAGDSPFVDDGRPAHDFSVGRDDLALYDQDHSASARGRSRPPPRPHGSKRDEDRRKNEYTIEDDQAG
jgi:hypothetical protein